MAAVRSPSQLRAIIRARRIQSPRGVPASDQLPNAALLCGIEGWASMQQHEAVTSGPDEDRDGLAVLLE